jgi:mannan endo-1,4-beta-mannosidase
VPVLFRPLHEQNGNFFWWGHDGSRGAALRARQAAWVAMWRDLVTELTVRKGLANLVFVFGTNQVNFNGVAPPLTYYPGARWADVVSIDLYDEQLDLAGGARGLQHYAALIGTGKPFGIAEFGQSFGDSGTGPGAAGWDARTLVRRIRDSYPRTVFAVAWYSSVEGGHAFVFALPDVSFGLQLLQDPLIDTQ